MGASPATALIAVALSASLAAAELPSWLGHEELSGRWGGQRDLLAAHGIDVQAGFVSEIFGNPVGGERQSAQAVSSTSIDLWFDLHRLAGVPGLRFHLSGVWRAGRSLSSEDIGNVFAVQEAFGNETIRLVAFAIEQSLLDDHLQVVAGRLSPGDDFATSDLYCFFVQSAVCANPFGLLLDDPSFAIYPITTWGARARAVPAPWGYAAAGVYQADQALTRDETHGVDFSIRGDDGVLTVGEVGYRTGTFPGGLPGRFTLGGWYDSSVFTFLRRPARTRHGNGGAWVQGEQMVYREPQDDAQGLTPFVALSGSPPAVSVMPINLMAGLVYRGLFPDRDADTTVLGLVWGAFSDDLAQRERDAQRVGRRTRGPKDDEIAIELGHRFVMAPWLPWLTVQPDVQYIVDPGGSGDIPDALALGVQLAVTF